MSEPTVTRQRSRSVAGPRIAGGSAGARQWAAVILQVLAGEWTPGDGAQSLGVSLPRYYAVESRAMAGLVQACEPRSGKRRETVETVTGYHVPILDHPSFVDSGWRKWGHGSLSPFFLSSEMSVFLSSKGIASGTIAYYGFPTWNSIEHVARKSGGNGTGCSASSKLGQLALMAHNLAELSGGTYGFLMGGN